MREGQDLIRNGSRTDRVAALVAELGVDAQIGFHGHENLGLAVANSVLAYRAGAKQIDGSTRRFGAGAGNTPVEAFVGVCDKLGLRTGIDFFSIVDAAEDVVRPVMPDECTLDRMALIMGYAGVYSSFLKHAYALAERYRVSGAEILVRAGQRGLIGAFLSAARHDAKAPIPVAELFAVTRATFAIEESLHLGAPAQFESVA